MADLKRIRSIAWRRGMLVEPEHLRHTDARSAQLSSLAAGVAADNFGLVEIEGRPGAQLAEIRSRPQRENNLRLDVTVSRSFAAYDPGGNLLIIEASDKECSCVLELDSRTKGREMLLCISDNPASEIEEGTSREEGERPPLERASPMLEIIPMESALQSIMQGDHIMFPIGKGRHNGREFEPDNNYIPPVFRFGLVGQFNERVLGELKEEIIALGRKLERVHRTLVPGSEGAMGRALAFRVADIGVLRMLLISIGSKAEQIESLSVREFRRDIIIPIASWARAFTAQFPRAGQSADAAWGKATRLASDLSAMEAGQMSLDVGSCLISSCNFMRELGAALTII